MRTTLLIIVSFLPHLLFSQFQKDAQVIGAETMVNYIKYPKSQMVEAQLNPSYGLFLGRNILMGFQFGTSYNFSDSKYTSYTYYNTIQKYSPGFFFREYLPLNDGKYGFFLQQHAIWDFYYTRYSRSNSTAYYTSEISQNRIGMSPGIFMFLSESNALEFTFSYLYFLHQDNRPNTFGFNSSANTFLVGFKHYFDFPRSTRVKPDLKKL